MTYDNDHIDDYWMKITNQYFNDSPMQYYYNFRSLRKVGLIDTRPTLPISSYKQQYPVNNLKRNIKYNPDPPKFDMVKPLYNDIKLIT